MALFAVLVVVASAVAAAGVSAALSGAEEGQGPSARTPIFGTQRADILRGTTGDDLICGLGGDDRIDGLTGNDLIFGAAGNDRIVSGGGNDQVRGGPGNDRVFGNGGRDLLDGERDDDTLDGGAGDDGVVGRAGNDRLSGGAGNDKIGGREGNDVLRGGSGRDFLSGGGGNDRSFGEGGNDVLHGGPDRDRLAGGVGNDKLEAGGGARNVLLGQQGTDVFDALNGFPDRIVGGPGRDRARIDQLDVIQLIEAVVRGVVPARAAGNASDPPVATARYAPLSADQAAACRGATGNPSGPESVPANAATPEDTLLSLRLTGASPFTTALNFVLGLPQHGSAAVSGAGSCTTAPAPEGLQRCSVNATYTPSADYFGADQFGFTVDSAQGSSTPGPVTLDVSEVNDPPVTAPDTVASSGAASIEIGVADVLANDRPGPANETAQKLAVQSVRATEATHGIVSLAAGKVVYTPDPDYAGPAAATYTACDDGTTAGRPDPRCSDGTIAFGVDPNRPPTAKSQEVTTAEDTSLALTLAGEDPDGDALSFAIADAPAHGTLTGTAPNLTYTPSKDFYGADSLTFTTRDGKLTSAPATLDIAVTEVNDDPAAEPDDFAVGVAEATVIAGPLILFNDLAGPSNEAGQQLEIGAVTGTPETHGTVHLVDGGIAYTPDPGFSGQATIRYTLCDRGTTDGEPDPLCDSEGSVKLFVTRADRPPVAHSLELETAEDTQRPVTLTATDPDGDALTFRIVDPPDHGSLTGTAPALIYHPAGDYFGEDSFKFVANDGQLDSEPASVDVNVTEVNDPPVLALDTFPLGGAGELPPLPPRPSCTEACGVVYGDPHAYTYDHGPYHFQAVGEFIAGKSTIDDFEVQIRTKAVEGSRLVSLVTAVGMRIGGHRISMYRTLTGAGTFIDGVQTEVPAFPQTLTGGTTIGTYGSDHEVFIVSPDGSVVIISAVGLYEWSYRFTVSVGLSPARLTKMVGLLGNGDDIRANDLVTRDGVPIDFPPYPTDPDFEDLYQLFGHSWRISQAESLFDYAPGQTTDTFTDRTFPDRPITPADLPPAVGAAARTQCGTFGVTDPAILDACVIDVGVTGDPEFATSSAEAQEDALDIPNNTGVTSLGTTTTVTVDTAGQRAVRAFTVTAGQKATLTITGNTISPVDLTIRRPDGSFLTSLTVTGDSAFHDTFSFPVEGTYTITIDPRDDHTGSLTFSLDPVPDNVGEAAIGLPSTVMIGTVGENAVRSFTGSAGQMVTLSVSGNTIPIVDLTVRKPDGTFLTSLTVSTDSGFHDTFTLPVDGTYTITVDPRLQHTGMLTFSLDQVPANTGTTAIGTATPITIGTVGENAVRSFTGSAGQMVTLSVSGNTIPIVDLTVRKPDDFSLTSLTVSTDSGFHDTFTLPVAGTYTITVDPRQKGTGALTFSLDSVPENTGTTAVGTPTDVTIGTVGENAVRTFTATAGQRVALAVSGNTIPIVDLTVRQPDGTSVGNLTVSSASAFREPMTLPVAGTYSITIDPRVKGTGSLTFTLSDVPAGSGATAIGVPTNVTISTAGENSVWTFSATAGQLVTLTVTGNTIPGVDLTVRQPNGTFVATLGLTAATAFRDTFALPATGTYTLLVDPRVTNTGSLTFVIGAVPQNTDTTSLGTPTTVTIGTPGENAVRSFTATAGQKLSISVSGNTIPGVDLSVRQPNGTFVGSVFTSGAATFRDTMTLAVAGMYTITLDPSGQGTGTTTFTLNAVPENTGATSLGIPTTVTMGTPGENAVRSFAATAGQKVSISVSGNTVAGVDLAVRQPNGTFVGSVFTSGASTFRDTMTLPVAGTYTVTVDPSGALTGSTTFTLNAVPDNTGATALGTPTTVTIGTPGENAVRTFTATAGQKVSISVTGNTISDGDLEISRPNGSFVGSLFLSDPTEFRDTLTLDVAGTYTATVDASGPNVGTATFTLHAVPENTGAIAFGTPAAVTIGTPGENAVRTFTGTANQHVTLSFTGNTISSGELVIRKPDGSFVDSLFVSGATGFLDDVTLPVAGTYTLTIDPSGAATGTLTVRLADVGENTGTTAIGVPTTVTIASAGQNATRTFTGAAGQLVVLNVSGNTIPGVDVILNDPDGDFLDALFVFGPTATSSRPITLPVNGTYTLLIDPEAEATGSLTFTVAAVPATAIGVPTPVTIAVAGQPVFRSFPASAGQRVTLSVAGNTAPFVDLIVEGPDGSFVGDLFVDGPAAVSEEMTLEDAGNYTVSVNAFGGTGSLTFTLNAVLRSTVVRHIAASVDGEQVASSATPLAKPKLVITAAQVLENDRPGPPNESDQHLALTAVNTTGNSHGTAVLAGQTITYTANEGFTGSASITYSACDDGTTHGDPDPRCSDGTISIQVTENHPPTAAGQQVSTQEGTPVAVTLAGADADGDTVAFRITEPPAHGTLSGLAPALIYTPAPDFNGADSFRYAANDTHDESAPALISITVGAVNDKPSPVADSITAGAGKTAAVSARTLAANDSPGPFDERGQALAVTAVTPTADTHGTVTFEDGAVTYTPDAGFTGTAKVRYTVCDNGTTSGAPDPRCDHGELSIVPNLPPTATAGAASTQRNTAVPITLAGTDPEGDLLTFETASQPEHGVLTGTGATRTYTPNAGFTSSDSFTFTAADAFNKSAPETVSIEVTATRPPVIKADAVAMAMNTSVLVDVLANDAALDGTLDPATLAVVVAPTKGTAVKEAGKIRYTPNTDVEPDDRFTYEVCDTFGVCGRAEVTVSTVVPNRTPVAVADDYTMDVGTTLEPAAPGILANDSDPDPGDAIQARLDTGVSAGNLLLRFDGSFRYTPSLGFSGLDSFTYTVVDRAGLRSAPVRVTIDVVPLGPAAIDDEYTTTKNNPLTVMPAGVLGNDRDAHTTDILTAGLNRAAFRGTVDLNPDGSFVYIPDPDFVGTDSFLYVATDIRGVPSAAGRVQINVTAPTCALPAVGALTPADGTEVTAPTAVTANIAVPTGETVAEWKVTVRNQDRGTPVILGSGTGAPPPSLAMLDPTQLTNGPYQILVSAKASGGCTATAVSNLVVTGEMKLGHYKTKYLDLETAIHRFPVQVLRSYDSIDKRRGDFGVGWQLELSSYRATPNNRLGLGGWKTEPFGFPFTRFRFKTSVPHFVTVTAPNGKVEVFDFVPAPSGPLLSLTVPEFVARKGTGTTSKLEDVDSPILSLAGTSVASFFGNEIYDARLFRLTTADKFVLLIDRFDGLQSIMDPNGNKLLVSADGVRSTATDRELTFTRDGAGRIAEVRGPDGKRTRYEYSKAADLTGVEYPNGATQELKYDARHNLIVTSGAGQVVNTLHYDASGRLTAITDGNGNTSHISVDVAGHQQAFTDATGRLTTIDSYDERGNLAQQDRVAGGKTITTKATYDAEGRWLTKTDGRGQTRKQTYDAAGNVLTQTDARNKTTTYTYNAFGQRLTITDPLSHVTTNTYDSKGNLTQTEAADGGITKHTYDATGNLVTTTDPVTRVTTHTYDGNGQLETVSDPAGNLTRLTLDANGQVSAVIDPSGATTNFSYDGRGNLLRVTDGNGRARIATYDVFDRLTSLTDPTGAITRQSYDAVGNLTSVTDRNGKTIGYAYDAAGRLISKTFPGGGAATYTYDGFGRRLTLENATARLALTYDDADHVLTVTSTPSTPGALPTSTFTYSYDANGNMTSVQGPGGTTQYGYDAKSQLTGVTDPSGDPLTLGYDQMGRQTSLTRPNGISDTTSYDEAGNLTSLHSMLGPTLVNKADYTYSNAGNRATLTTAAGTASFGYEAASRLTSATFPASTGLPAEQYTYDRAGNRTSSVGSPAGSFTYDAASRLLADGKATYQYDGEGNLLSRTVTATGAETHFEWSAEHELLGITHPDDSTTTLRYDPAGRRVEIKHGTTTERYAYDRQVIAAEYDGTNALVASYVHDPVSRTRKFEMTRGGQRYFYLTDALGSTTALTTITGATANSYTYDAFGRSVRTGTVANPFTFTGQPFDPVSGLSLFPMRVYDAALGRFLSEDPVLSSNPYPYVDSNPINLLDPSGAAIGGFIRGCFLGAALVVGAASAAPGGAQLPELAGECAKAILEARERRRELQEMARLQQIVRAQLVHRK